MTVAVAVKVFDGIALASDSATSLSDQSGAIAHVYNSANKIFHLHRKKPIGAMTWGLGHIGAASISTLCKDLRRRLMGLDPDHQDWELTDGFTVESVIGKLVEMMHGELYAPEYAGVQSPPVLGFLVAGYSDGEQQAEIWGVTIDNASTTPTPVCEAPGDTHGWIVKAQTEAAQRLFMGFDETFGAGLAATLDPASLASIRPLFDQAQRIAVVAPMPFEDAINFARFLVDTTIGYSHFVLGPDTVGGPVEVAGLSRHEGFKWICRKHYYPAELNPEDPGHDF